VPLQADGDLNAGNIRRVAEAGADAFVIGRALFGAPDPAQALRALREQLAAAGAAAVTP
jgi:ribulose-phosphate 3-epimerase